MDTSRLPLSPGMRAGDVVYVSGQLGFTAAGTLIDGGIEEQALQTLKNVERVLAEHGATLKDVVKMNIWLTSRADFPQFNAVYSQHFEPGEFPTRSTVVSELLIEGAKIEIDAIAYLGE